MGRTRRGGGGIAGAAGLLALLAAASGRAQEPVALAAPEQLAALERCVREIAAAGRIRGALEVLDCARVLGLAANRVLEVERGAHEAAATSDTAPGPRPREAQSLRTATTALVPRLGALPPDDARRLAGTLLRLDGDCAAARRLLGHERSPTGGWQAQDERLAATRQVRLLEFAARARALPVEITLSDSTESLVRGPGGSHGTKAELGGLVLHTQFDRATAARILREAARAAALSGALCTDEWPTGNRWPVEATYVWVTSQAAWEAAIALCTKEGTLVARKPDLTEEYEFWDSRGFRVRKGWEPSFAASTMAWVLAEGGPPLANAPTFAATGHMDWIAMTYLGACPGVWRGQVSLADPRDSGLPEAFARQRVALRRLTGAGLAGHLAWVAHLMRQEEDPGLDRFIVRDLGRLVGDVRSKLSVTFAWLHGLGPARDTLGPLVGPNRVAAEDFARAAGGSVADVEARLRHWVLDGRSGVADLLDPPDEPAPTTEARGFATALRAVRGRAFGADVPATIVEATETDGRLSLGCRLHAEYLRRTPAASPADALIESAGLPLASAAGAWAAHHALVGRTTADPGEALEEWMATLEGRAALLAPGLARIGVGHAGTVLVVDARSMVKDVDEHWSLVWPPDGARDVPRRYGRGGLPVGDGRGECGYPLSVHRSPWRGGHAIAGMTLTRVGTGAEVPGRFVTANDAAWSSRLPPQVFALVPDAPLAARADYTVEARVVGDSAITWSFRTGR